MSEGRHLRCDRCSREIVRTEYDVTDPKAEHWALCMVGLNRFNFCPDCWHSMNAGTASENEGFHLASFRKNTTGVDHSIWLSTKGGPLPCIRVASDPPDSLDHAGKVAHVAVHDGSVVEGDMPAEVLEQVQEFIELNRDAVMRYWNDEIDTFDLVGLLKPIPAPKQ